MLQTMRALVILTAFLLLGGCAELWYGPRTVSYSPVNFYLRSSPMTSDATLDAMAEEVCISSGQKAQRLEAYQWYALDLRYVVYRCGDLVELPATG